MKSLNEQMDNLLPSLRNPIIERVQEVKNIEETKSEISQEYIVGGPLYILHLRYKLKEKGIGEGLSNSELDEYRNRIAYKLGASEAKKDFVRFKDSCLSTIQFFILENERLSMAESYILEEERSIRDSLFEHKLYSFRRGF